MKKFRLAFALCAILVLSGCSLKTEYNMKIKDDKSMDFSVIVGMDDELINGMLSMEDEPGEEKEYTDEEIWAMLESSNESEENPEQYGFTKSRYEENGYKGFKYTKNISNIDDISGSVANFKLEDYIKISDSIVFIKDGKNYKANFVMSSDEQSEGIEGYDIGIDMKFVISLPNKPISNNATEVSEDGKTLTWNLLNSNSQNIQFEFSFKNNTLLYVGAITTTIVIFSIIAIFFILKNNKKQKNNNTTQEQPNIDQPQIVPEQPSMDQPQIVPEQPSVDQPQIVPEQPNVDQPQIIPEQPSMPSVSDILDLAEKKHNENN